MNSLYLRTEKLIGAKAIEVLKKSKVAVFGIGGVGSYAVEALVRAGVGNITLIDNDIINQTNINRQLIALHSTVGKKKTSVAAKRAYDINPDIKIDTYDIFYDKNTAELIDLSKYDYILDAIDTVSSKLILIERAKDVKVPIISSMGTGNKINPQLFEVQDIEKTSVCPLAKVMRKELKERGIKGLKVLYSKEKTLVKERTPASISFVPPVAGLIMAGEAIKDLIGGNYDL